MADILAAIVARKRLEVAARLDGRRTPAEPTRRSLRAALEKPGGRFIMEVKRASPSGHVAAAGVDQAIAAYAPIADAISVLLDGPAFGGSFADLALVRQGFDGPIIAKDFVVDPVQVSEARAYGADVVLVMLSVLDDVLAAAVIAEARSLGMDALVEVHDDAELERALALEAPLIGINNRNLKTLAIDLAVTERLAPRVPKDRVLVSESGIGSNRDVRRLAPLVDGFLVGSALMASSDIRRATRELVFGATKICGLTRAEDVRAAAAAGASHAGFIVVPDTPRAIAAAVVAPLAAEARSLGMIPVGVFRDAPPREIAEAVRATGFGAVQLHGSETAADIAQLRTRLPEGVEIWAIRSVGSSVAPPRAGSDRDLFDRAGGGTGQTFDWSLLAGDAGLAGGWIAGGLNPDNIAEAAAIGAYGLDIGSGVEAASGIKDHDRLAALFDARRPANREQVS